MSYWVGFAWGVALMGVAWLVWWDYRSSAEEHEKERRERATRIKR